MAGGSCAGGAWRAAGAPAPGSVTRRAVLAGSAAVAGLLAAACRGVQVLGAPPPLPADVRLLQAVIAAERSLISRYQSALTQAHATDPAALASLSSLLAEHQEHLAQLSARLIVPAGSSHAPKPAASAPPAGDLRSAVGALATAESAAADRLAGQLLSAPPSLAQLMASISASEATHVGVLTALRGQVR